MLDKLILLMLRKKFPDLCDIPRTNLPFDFHPTIFKEYRPPGERFGSILNKGGAIQLAWQLMLKDWSDGHEIP